MQYDSSFQTTCMSILDTSLTCLCSIVYSLLFWLQSLRWAMSEFSHFQLSSWIKLFLASLDLHEVLHCLSSIFWWLSLDCLCSVWCVYHVSILQSFDALHALSLQFSSFISETFSELLKLLSLLHTVQYFRF